MKEIVGWAIFGAIVTWFGSIYGRWMGISFCVDMFVLFVMVVHGIEYYKERRWHKQVERMKGVRPQNKYSPWLDAVKAVGLMIGLLVIGAAYPQLGIPIIIVELYGLWLLFKSVQQWYKRKRSSM